MVQLNVSDADRVKKTRRKTHPVSLVIKQSSGCVQHLGIGFLLAHIGDKVGRVGMHLHRNLSKNLFTSASVISIHSYHGFSFIHLFLVSGAIGSMGIQSHATAKRLDFESEN
jgi:hypothetical protein